MGDSENPTRGKLRLDLASYGADLSGRDFDSVYVERPQSLSHSFLNGVSLTRSAFLGAPIDQAELAEAQIIDCSFNDTDFTGSSFIGATVQNTAFHNCNFADGEWRKSRFTNVIFEDCNFNYTTINLCIFDSCNFVGEGTKYLSNRSVNYNVFTRSSFTFTCEDDVVLANNFGLPSQGLRKSLVHYGSGISLEEICVKSSTGKIVVSEFVDAIDNEFRRVNVSRLKVLRLEFVSNIISALACTKKISATSLAYLEGLFLALAKVAQSETDALAAMSVVLNVRSLLFNLSEMISLDAEYATWLCQAVDIRYERTYSKSDVKELAEILGELTTGNPTTFSVHHFSRGSTFIELAATQVVSVAAVLTALNLVLRQLNTTLVQSQRIRANIAKLFDASLKRPKKRRRKSASRVPALQRSGQLSKEQSLLRQTVVSHGLHAVVLDDEAEITIHYASSK